MKRSAPPPSIATRPNTPDARESRPSSPTIDRLLDAAYDEFAAMGYEAASIEGIARRAGAGRMTFYRHFSGKDVIFSELVRRDWAHVRVELGFLETDSREPQLVLLDVAKHYHDMYSSPRHRNLMRMIISAAQRFPHITRELLFSQRTQPLTNYFNRLIQRGVLARRDPDRLARMFFRMVVEVPKVLLLDEPSDDADARTRSAALSDCVEIFLSGARKSVRAKSSRKRR